MHSQKALEDEYGPMSDDMYSKLLAALQQTDLSDSQQSNTLNEEQESFSQGYNVSSPVDPSLEPLHIHVPHDSVLELLKNPNVLEGLKKLQKGDSDTLANIKQEKDDDAMSGVSELNYTPKPGKRLSTIDAMADSFTSPSAKQQKRTPVYSKSPSKTAASVKPKVHQSLDYSTLSPNAQPSTVEPPNFEALRKEVAVKHDQIEKANEFLCLQ